MKLKDVFHMLLFLACIGPSVFGQNFIDGRDSNNNHVMTAKQLKFKGRRRHNIRTLDDHENDSNNVAMKPAATGPTTGVIGADANKNNTKFISSDKKELETNYPDIDMHTIFYILLSVSAVVIGYFVIRMVRAKTRRKTKKYGMLTTQASEVELTPLGQEDDDEDMTVFDANSK